MNSANERKRYQVCWEKIKGMALTKLGKALAFVLDKIDPNHCLKSIDELV